MGGTPAFITSKTSFMTVMSELTTSSAQVSPATVIMPPQKHSSTDATIVIPALMLLEMEDSGDCSSSCCDEESTYASMSRRGSLIARKVCFASVEVREYTVTIGDHPCCTQGCPLSLDWEYRQGQVTTVEAFESTRATKRRHRNCLRTSWEERRDILSQESISEWEIRKAQRKLHRARSCDSRLCEKMSDAFFNSA